MHEKVQDLRLCPLIFKDFALQCVSLKGSVNTFLPLSFRGSFTKKEGNKKSLCINRKWKKNFAMHGRTKFHAFSDKKRRRAETQKIYFYFIWEGVSNAFGISNRVQSIESSNQSQYLEMKITEKQITTARLNSYPATLMASIIICCLEMNRRRETIPYPVDWHSISDFRDLDIRQLCLNHSLWQTHFSQANSASSESSISSSLFHLNVQWNANGEWTYIMQKKGQEDQRNACISIIMIALWLIIHVFCLIHSWKECVLKNSTTNNSETTRECRSKNGAKRSTSKKSTRIKKQIAKSDVMRHCIRRCSRRQKL